MTAADYLALLPLAVLNLFAIVVMLAIAFHRSHNLTFSLTTSGLVSALAALPLAYSAGPRHITALLTLDSYFLFFTGLFLCAGLAICWFARGYFARREQTPEEFYVLLLVAITGACAMAGSSHFASFYLALETLSVSLYAMIAYTRSCRKGTEASIKYLVLAAASAAFMLFGIALIYAETGSMALRVLAQVTPTQAGNRVFTLGTAMVLIGLGFKLSIVPFQLWTPDVYQGAPAPVSAFIATVSKGAVLAMLLRYLTYADPQVYSSLLLMLMLSAIASMFFGNLLALRQTNLKRLLACSSIAHLGYMSLAFLASSELGMRAVLVYLVVYFITSIGAFGVISVYSAHDPSREKELIEDYRGLMYKNPVLGFMLAAMLLSLAGIPLTAGFIGKFFILGAGVKAGLWWPLAALVISSAIGLVYYLRVVLILCAPVPESSRTYADSSIELTGSIALAVLTLLLFGVGIAPAPLLNLIEHWVVLPGV